MNSIAEQLNMQQQQFMTVMQTQNQLQNKINELKNKNDWINMALQMKQGGNYDASQANLIKDEHVDGLANNIVSGDLG